MRNPSLTTSACTTRSLPATHILQILRHNTQHLLKAYRECGFIYINWRDFLLCLTIFVHTRNARVYKNS